MASYDYVRRTYSVDPTPGRIVTHTITGKIGIITHEDKSQGHYVQVKFPGQKHSLPCHPTELDYAPPPQRSEDAGR